MSVAVKIGSRESHVLRSLDEPDCTTPGARRALAALPTPAQWALLFGEAQRLGVEVKLAPIYLEEKALRGVFIPAHSLILLDSGLNKMQRFETLAHELGHAFHGHDSTTLEAEREAWVRAAVLTVDGEVVRAAGRVDPSCEAIALAAGVSPLLVWWHLRGEGGWL